MNGMDLQSPTNPHCGKDKICFMAGAVKVTDFQLG